MIHVIALTRRLPLKASSFSTVVYCLIYEILVRSGVNMCNIITCPDPPEKCSSS